MFQKETVLSLIYQLGPVCFEYPFRHSQNIVKNKTGCLVLNAFSLKEGRVRLVLRL